MSSRSRAVIATLWAFLAFQLLAQIGNAVGMASPSGGFATHTHHAGEVHAVPITPAAAHATRELGNWNLEIRSVNGHQVSSHPCGMRSALSLEPGHENSFVVGMAAHRAGPPDATTARLAGREGKRITVPVQHPSLAVAARVAPSAIAFPIVGLLYVLLGLGVWWRRPNDRAAVPLLLFSLVPGTHFTFNLHLTPLAHTLSVVSDTAPALYGPGLLNLALKLTGFNEHGGWRWLLRGSLAGALVLVLVSVAAHMDPISADAAQLLQILVGAHVAIALAMTVVLAAMANRQRQAPGLRRRARILAVGALLAFLFPAASLILPRTEGMWLPICLSLSVFPVAIAYGIVSVGMFDIRFVVGPGLAYVASSTAGLLVYLALSAVALSAAGFDLELSGISTPPPLAIALFAGLFLLLSLGQLRLQGSINRRIFRTRYVYADAIANASDELSTARSRSAITQAARSALLDSMRLSRAYIAVPHARQAGPEQLACTQLAQQADPLTGIQPEDLPATLKPSLIPPIARALASDDAISAHDSAAASAQIAGVDDCCDNPGTDERTFWTHYGIEWIVPLALSRDDHTRRILGLLLVGPKLDGRPLDKTDRSLLSTLANQLAVAMENAEAFEQIQQLKDGLEAEVEARTTDLKRALSDLERAQGQLIESEKQAALGRLVAGIVHEVNSPLGSLRSAADTSGRMMSRLREAVAEQADHGDEHAKRLLAATENGPALTSLVLNSSERLDQLMASLKRFVSLDEGEARPFDVREGLDGALALLSPKLGDNITVERNYDSDDPVVTCNPARLNQVFLNLIDNAATALDGHGHIAIHVSRTNGKVEIAVEDDGPGISEPRLRELFDFGFTSKDGRVRMRVGLPSNKRAIEQLGGQLHVESQTGQGTAVRLALPASQQH